MFSFGRHEKQVAVIFDVGNGSIAVSLVEFQAHGAPLVHYTHREPLTFIPHVTSARLLETMLKLLKFVAEHLAKEVLPHVWTSYFGHTIQHVYCVMSSPWYVSQTKIIKFEKDKPFQITKAFIDDIVRKEQDLFTKELAEGKYEKLFGPDVRLLEKKIIHTKLNGYEVHAPIGKQAKELEVTFFSSYISNDIMTRVEKMLRGIFHFKNLTFYSYALTSWSSVRDLYPDAHNFLFLDISGEVTDVMLTSKGVLMETVSFPAGRSAFIRKIAEAFSVPPEVALSYLAVHNDESSEEKFAVKLGEVIEDAEEKWFQSLIKVLGDLGKKYTLPSQMYVTVDDDVAEYFMNVLKRAMPLELSLPQNTFEVVMLDAKQVKSFVAFRKEAHEDPFIALESVFVNKIIALS